MNKNTYDDIIGLPHYEPKNHERMSLYKRAAQFAPFAALTGYGDAVKEAARYTDSAMELSEDEAVELDRKLHFLLSQRDQKPEVRVVYFKPDEKKAGGAFLEITGRVVKVDDFRKELIMDNGERIPIRAIIDFDGKMPGDMYI